MTMNPVKAIQLTLSFVAILLPSTLLAYQNTLKTRLLPPNKRYYVCFKHRLAMPRDQFSRYYHYRYLGCRMQNSPCYQGKGQRKFQFGRFKTHSLAINAYYRCADS